MNKRTALSRFSDRDDGRARITAMSSATSQPVIQAGENDTGETFSDKGAQYPQMSHALDACVDNERQQQRYASSSTKRAR